MEMKLSSDSPKVWDRIKRFLKTPYMLVVPALIFYLLFWAYPVFNAVKDMFTGVGGGFTLSNITLLFQEALFWEALLNTLVFAFVSIVIQFILALLLALLINRKFKGSGIFLFLMMLPMAIPIAAVGIIWNTGLTEFGWINSILENTGLQWLLEALKITDGPIVWTGVKGMQAVMFLVVVDTWTVLPSVMIIILAGLQNLNKEYQEAALVFGATKKQTVTDIIIPIIKPTIITSLLLRIISGVQVWLISVMIFGHSNVPFLVERIVYYQKNFFSDELLVKIAIGYSILVVLIVMTIATIFLRVSRKSERSMNNA